MLTILSLVTSVKDYVEIAHKLIETDTTLALKNYSDFGGIVTYLALTVSESAKDFFVNLISLKWLQTLWSLPIIVPDISSAMISEISILDGYFHNAFTFLDTPISYGNQNFLISSIEKFVIGLINSLFLFLPSSTAHIITLRRFVMQGLEAGFVAGLGTIAGNILWISSIILGWRFFVIPWLSLDIFRYFLGFILLIKYMWDCYNEKRVQLNAGSNTFLGITYSQTSLKFFLLNFLLALTEQTCFYPFLTNISISPESSILETFPSENFSSFISIHFCYIAGLLIGSLSLLHFSCWFWENPAFKIYMWFISSASANLRITTSYYYKIINFVFLYLTMICAISSIPYYGLDYLLTNPLGLISEDRITNSYNDKKQILELSFLNSKASDKNTRRNRGRHGRRERWKRRVRKYRTFDASLYDQGIYDLFTIEDLNYGFDRFWLRRKMRNHRVRFRFFPGPWMRSFKKQLAKPRLESSTGPRSEFFRILFEQVYHPTFHDNKKRTDIKSISKPTDNLQLQLTNYLKPTTNNINVNNKDQSLAALSVKNPYNTVLRKFVRKFEKRIKTNQIAQEITTGSLNNDTKVYSKRWKKIISKYFSQKSNSFFTSQKNITNTLSKQKINPIISPEINLSKNESKLLRYKSIFTDNKNTKKEMQLLKPQTLLHPIKFYLQKEQAFERKLRYYSPTLFRTFSVENNAPYFRIMMKKYFYHYKPTRRWKRTMRVASLRKARRKSSRLPRKLSFAGGLFTNKNTEINYFTPGTDPSNSSNLLTSNTINPNQLDLTFSSNKTNNQDQANGNLVNLSAQTLRLQKPTNSYSIVSKKATRYRYKIYRDVLQHWYYTPFNRLLLKFDVDSFIKRQPYSHFLTKKEENLLHLRRFLLSEHYNTLRWYSYMQHYRTMKNKIGGTKSFASRTYNQQFQGTFKKIRHLFAITPNQITSENISNPGTEKTILKFDQLLYNDVSKKSQTLKNEYLLEELTTSSNANKNPPKTKADLTTTNNNLILAEVNQIDIGKNSIGNNSDLLDNSMNIVSQYLKQATPIRQDYINNLIENKNYFELAQFIYKGQKENGVEPITNNKILQSTLIDKSRTDTEFNFSNSISNYNSFNATLMTTFLKKYKKNLSDQDFLKSFLTRKVEKLEKRKRQKEKHLKSRLNLLKNWLENSNNPTTNSVSNQNTTNSKTIVTTGLQKAFYSGANALNTDSNPLDVINKNKLKYSLLSKINLKNKTTLFNSKNELTGVNKNLYNKLTLQKLKNFANLKQEKEIITSIKTLSTISNLLNNYEANKQKSTANLNTIKKSLLNRISNSLKRIASTTKLQSITTKTKQIFDNLKNRKIKANAIKKQKRLRKVFKKIKMKKPREKYSLLTIDSQLNSSKLNLAVNNKTGTSTFIPIQDLNITNNDLKQTLERKKRDYIENENNRNLFNSIFNFKNSWEQSKLDKIENKNLLANIFTNKNFKRKRSPNRRAIYNFRQRRGPAAIKKRNITTDFTKKVKQSLEGKQKLMPESQVFNFRKDKSLKTRRSKLKRHRFWRTHKRTKYLQKYRKYRKTRQDAMGKIRVLSKQMQKNESKLYLQKWWTENFLPNLQANTNVLWQIEKDKQIQNKLNELYGLNSSNLIQTNQATDSVLQIGNQDFKPLFLTEKTPILIEKNSLETTNFLNNKTDQKTFGLNLNALPFYAGWDESLRKFVITNRLLSRREAGYTFNLPNLNDQSTTKTGKASDLSLITKRLKHFEKAPLQGMNAATTLYWQVPFTTYDPDQFFALGMDGFSPIGWRRFQFRHTILKNWITSLNTVTNKRNLIKSQTEPNLQKNKENIFVIDKNLLFKNSIKDLKANSTLNNSTLDLTLRSSNQTQIQLATQSQLKANKNKKNFYRRLKKRLRKVKKHPRSPVWFPSGPLLNQVLPVHYIYVFYKRNRLPKERYLKRRLLKGKKGLSIIKGSQINLNKTGNNFDFTLRRRVKAKRKYHRKPLGKNALTGVANTAESKKVEPRRLKYLKDQKEPFTSLEVNNNLIFERPYSSTKKYKETLKQTAATTAKASSQKSKKTNLGDNSNMLRVRQLRRRIQRQIFRPVWRYKPRAGGFVWPGDYLKLELIKAPILNTNTIKVSKPAKDSTKVTTKQKRKKKRAIQEWQIQPKKYLLEKHNLKIIKKKLQKSNRSQKIREHIKKVTLNA